MSEILTIDQLIRTMRRSSDSMERAQAARGIGHLKDPEAVDALLETLGDSNYEVRQAAIWALEQIRDE
ncbi:MAG: HEAT repeat domain-containing protein, partial [Promethearchaeota archaeon]